MPELPEVESLRRDLSATLVGRTIAGLELRLPKLFRPEPGLALEDLQGRRVERLRRRAKLLIWDLTEDFALVLHLKLTGQIVYVAADGQERCHGGHPVPAWRTPLPHKASHLRLDLDDGSKLYLTDIRQFARLWLMHAGDVETFLEDQGFGPEPLTDDFHLPGFKRALARRGVPVKTVLLDQSVIGGVGNIYADESLWAARVNPQRPANSLTAQEVRRLYDAVRSVLTYAIQEGVAFVPAGRALTDRDFPHAHGREGCACPRGDGGTIRKAWVGGRGTYWCARCQPGKGLRGGGAAATAARRARPASGRGTRARAGAA